jgi:hypothetical protein
MMCIRSLINFSLELVSMITMGQFLPLTYSVYLSKVNASVPLFAFIRIESYGCKLMPKYLPSYTISLISLQSSPVRLTSMKRSHHNIDFIRGCFRK